MNLTFKGRVAMTGLLALASQAEAQSTVTVYGTFDTNLRVVKNSGSSRRISESTGGLSTSQFAVRGLEDLGGGLKANFTLMAGFGPDTGASNNAQKFWDRRATVGLSGNWGEFRLGRDYVASYWNNAYFDPFNGVGIAEAINMSRSYVGTTVPGTRGGTVPAVNTYIRSDNTISYLLPAGIGGFYGHAMVAPGEGGVTSLGRYIGGRFGYSKGPVDVAVAYGRTRADALPTRPNFTTINIGASYDLAVVKLMSSYHRETNGLAGISVRENRWWLAAIVPVGLGDIRGSFVRSTVDKGSTAQQTAVAYVHNLSKRTALYSTFSVIQNSGNAATGGNLSIASLGSNSITALPTRGGSSKGAEFGIRHYF